MGGRPIKEGLSYFALDVDIWDNRKVRLFRNDLAATDRHSGFAIFVLLLARIYAGKGYYLTWDEDEKTAFCEHINIEIDVCNNVINACINRGLFDRNKFEKYGILTSAEIQKRFVGAVTRRKCIHVDSNYLIDDNINRISADINSINEGRKYTKEKKEIQSGINVYKNSFGNSSKTCPNGHRYVGDYCPECKAALIAKERAELEQDDEF
jgi:hypothetical protein